MNIEPIQNIAKQLGLTEDDVEPYGRNKAKIGLHVLERKRNSNSKLILVSAMNPTPTGEGKTTTSIGLAMGLRRLEKKVVLCLREPSLGPVFGVKGGGTGGGKATLVPADDINLHFTGDLHAISSANNLLSAMIDNACHFQKEIEGKGFIDPRQIYWGRTMDMNDRSLRSVIVGLGGTTGGVPRQDRFDITAASEIMAILALSKNFEDLKLRLEKIIIGKSTLGHTITAKDMGATGAMLALLKDAIKPNLVQTAEGGPAFVHAGPFANIAHGCSSVIATEMALRLSEYVITEAGFGFDLGGEKFLDIKCRYNDLWPSAVVLVVTLRALKMHGGISVSECSKPNREGLEKGLDHLAKHVETIAFYGLPVMIAINCFPDDMEEERVWLKQKCSEKFISVAFSESFSKGGEGAIALAKGIMDVIDKPRVPKYPYLIEDSLEEKIRKLSQIVYGARDVVFTDSAKKELRFCQSYDSTLPVCIAKTPLSLSDDPKRVGRPKDFVMNVREIRLSAGAGFVVAITGDIMTMPGLPKNPAALRIDVLPNGKIRGLMQNEDTYS